MATQTIEFSAVSGQTITARLFAAGSDTVAATASSVTERTNATGVYAATVTSTLAGVYRLVATNASGTLLAQWWVRLANADGDYIAYESPNADYLDATVSSRLAAASYTAAPSAASNATAVRTELTTELARIDATVSSRSTFAGGAVASVTAGVTLTAGTVADIQSGLATAANQTTIIQYIDTEVAAIKAVTDKLNTGLVQDGAVYQFTVNMLENGPAGAGGGSATIGNQELILDQLDLIQVKTDLISGAGAIGPLLAGAVLEPGTITGFPTSLTIGDSYTTANGRAIQLPIVDTDGNPISSTGSLLFADASVTFTISRARETDSNRIITGTAAVVDPAGTGTAEAPYALVQLSSSETSKGKLGYKYNAVLKFTWPGTGTDVMSFESSTEVQFDN